MLKNCYKFVDTYISETIKLIQVSVSINNQTLHLLSCFKSPSFDKDMSLNELESTLLSINLNDPIIILGDLNMNLFGVEGVKLTEFLDHFGIQKLCVATNSFGESFL